MEATTFSQFFFSGNFLAVLGAGAGSCRRHHRKRL